MADDICAQRNGRPHLYTGLGDTTTTCSACGQKHPDRVAAEAAVVSAPDVIVDEIPDWQRDDEAGRKAYRERFKLPPIQELPPASVPEAVPDVVETSKTEEIQAP